jgi:hypothetical protein
MGIATYGSMVFSSMKQILNDVHDADVFVVTLFRKQWFQQGLPDLDNLDPREKHLIILNDLMDETDQRVASLFTKKSHHKNISVMYIVQNLFHRPCWNSIPSTVPYNLWY